MMTDDAECRADVMMHADMIWGVRDTVPCNEVRVKGFYCEKLREDFKVLCQAYSGR